LLFPSLSKWPRDDEAAKMGFGYEPLKRDSREWMAFYDTVNQLPRPLPCRPVIFTGGVLILPFSGVELFQPLHDIAELTVAAEKLPDLGRNLLVLIEEAGVVFMLW
jgi:hypothetical protein